MISPPTSLSPGGVEVRPAWRGVEPALRCAPSFSGRSTPTDLDVELTNTTGVDCADLDPDAVGGVIPLAKPITYTSFYNGSPDFYEIPNHIILNNDSVLRLSYNATAAGPIGALNYLTYQSLPPGTYRVMFTDSGGIKNKLTDNLREYAA